MHDRDAVAEALGFVEVVRREENGRLAAVAEARDDVDQLGADPRVEADGRLVEEEHARPRDERTRDLQPPSLAAAVGRDRPIEQLGEPEDVGELLDARGGLAPGSTRQSRAWMSRLRRPVRDRSTTASWKTTLEIERAASGSVHDVEAREPRADPELGRSVVVSMPTVVDLPAPFGPRRPNTSPRRDARS